MLAAIVCVNNNSGKLDILNHAMPVVMDCKGEHWVEVPKQMSNKSVTSSSNIYEFIPVIAKKYRDDMINFVGFDLDRSQDWENCPANIKKKMASGSENKSNCILIIKSKNIFKAVSEIFEDAKFHLMTDEFFEQCEPPVQ